MKKLWKDKNTWLLFGGSIFLCWLFVGQYGIFGSRVDWLSQHSVFPDYFRRRFYETGSLFPDIAWNLGGGQNIYNLSYYGLYNPVILFSYLLPFVKMDTYLMGSSMICYGISVALFYGWLSSRKEFSRELTWWISCMFGLATPFIYHFYNQLMFVNYMPFLLLAFRGTDRYFLEKKKGVLLGGVVGMILTSFYFSIGGLAVLGIYAFSEYLLVSRKDFWKKGMGYVGNLLFGVLLCGGLLLPTALAISSGRGQMALAESELSFIDFVPMRFLYSPYGIGLSVLAVLALLGGILKKSSWRRKVLPGLLLLLLTVSLFCFWLNGGLYDKNKVFIPFLPLICLETARYIKDTFGENRDKSRRDSFREVLPFLILLVLFYLERNSGQFSKYWLGADMDLALMLILFALQKKLQLFRIPWLVVGSCVILFFCGWGISKQSHYILGKEEYKELVNQEQGEEIIEILEEDAQWYRLDQVGEGKENQANLNRIKGEKQQITSLYSSAFNPCYWKFRNEIFLLNQPFRNYLMQSQTDNPCFLQFMGVRYLISSWKPAGYEMVKNQGSYQIYKNDQAAPLIYATNQVMGEEEYKNLEFPLNQTALLSRAVVEQEKKSRTTMKEMEKCEITLPEQAEENLVIEKTEDGYEVTVKKETEVKARLFGKGQKGDLLALQFQVENLHPTKDMYIRLLNQTNRLTDATYEYANHNTVFRYMVTLEEENQMTMKFGPGHYKICQLQAFCGELEELRDENLYQNFFEAEEGGPTGDVVKGSLQANQDGYLITSIPYDENFTLKIDGEETGIEKVNTAFLGAKIEKGEHRIELSYEAPGKRAGMGISLMGILLVGIGKVGKRRGVKPGDGDK